MAESGRVRSAVRMIHAFGARRRVRHCQRLGLTEARQKVDGLEVQ
ncbi:conserved hypothetical protein [Xanthomonas campestris pv. raphani 756C]|nr:conserved hypothetical protein [Xanthomonas campestris pv. raphani 756C]